MFGQPVDPAVPIVWATERVDGTGGTARSPNGFGTTFSASRAKLPLEMNPFAAFRPDDSDGGFDDPRSFVPEHLPAPGPFLEDHEVLEGDRHAAFHEVARGCFEERKVYDATFGYNLAQLNLDRRHPDAGYRYAVEADDSSVLRAEFTPTTPFCPQANALANGSFRAWNDLSDRHEYDLVRVRVDPMHHQSARINDELERAERSFREAGALEGDGAADARSSVESPF